MNEPAATQGDHYDVIVVGSGPGGGTTAATLAKTGKRVLLLERGDFLPRERANWESKEVFSENRYVANETFYDLHDKPFRPELHYFVGGNSKVYGAALFRLNPKDFGAVRHPDGISPEWPISYDDLEPYYVQAEHLYWVHGKHGEDPFAGPSSRDYKFPPVKHEPRIQELSDGLEKQGLHPFHLPIGVNLVQNADKHAGGARTLRVERGQDAIRVSVIDAGPGLEREGRDRMFDRYWRGVADGTGKGLGLALVRAVAELHGGVADARQVSAHGLDVGFSLAGVRGWNETAREELSSPSTNDNN